MQQGTLQEILAVEKEIRQRLDAEGAKARQWLDSARREIEAQHAADMARLEAAAAQSRQEAAAAAERKAARIVGEAEAAARAVAALADEQVRPAVARHIARILPGARRAR